VNDLHVGKRAGAGRDAYRFERGFMMESARFESAFGMAARAIGQTLAW
jgi:hypothetical protein